MNEMCYFIHWIFPSFHALQNKWEGVNFNRVSQRLSTFIFEQSVKEYTLERRNYGEKSIYSHNWSNVVENNVKVMCCYHEVTEKNRYNFALYWVMGKFVDVYVLCIQSQTRNLQTLMLFSLIDFHKIFIKRAQVPKNSLPFNLCVRVSLKSNILGTKIYRPTKQTTPFVVLHCSI